MLTPSKPITERHTWQKWLLTQHKYLSFPCLTTNNTNTSPSWLKLMEMDLELMILPSYLMAIPRFSIGPRLHVTSRNNVVAKGAECKMWGAEGTRRGLVQDAHLIWHQPLGETFLAYHSNVFEMAADVVSLCAVRPTKKSTTTVTTYRTYGNI